MKRTGQPMMLAGWAAAAAVYLWLAPGVPVSNAQGDENQVARTEVTAQVRYDGENYSLALDRQAGVLIFRAGPSGPAVLRLLVASSISAFDPATFRAVDDQAEGVQGVKVGELADEGGLRWEIVLDAGAHPWAAKSVLVDLYPDHWELRYRVSAPEGRPLAVNSVFYGGRQVPGEEGTEVRGSWFAGRQLYHWNADRQSQYLTSSSRILVELQSSVTPASLGPKPDNDLGRFLIPPYVAAFESARNGPWWGIGTLEVPQAATGLEVHVQGKEVYFAISPLGAIRIAAGESWTTPAVAFYAAAGSSGAKTAKTGETGPEKILRQYTETLFRRGLAARRGAGDALPQWWFEPIYTTWGDQVYFSRVTVGNDSQAWSLVNEKQVDLWLSRFEELGIPIGTVILDAGWYAGMPQWNANTGQWPDLRGWIERQHQQGRHVLLWMAPYWADFSFPEPFPGFYVRDLLGGLVTAPSMRAHLVDFSNPAVRDWFAERLRYLLGSNEGCLNADGLKIDFYYDRPDPRWRLYDPSWGVGERYQLNTLNWIYATVKSIKPEALVTMSAANPFFNGTNDLVRVNDNWEGDRAFSVWKRRAAGVIAAGGNVMDSDDWIGYLQAGESWTQILAVRSVLAVPSLLCSRYRELHGQYVEPPADQWREAAALLQAYRLAPTTYASRLVVDLDAGIFRRYAGDSADLEAVILDQESGAAFYHRLDRAGATPNPGISGAATTGAAVMSRSPASLSEHDVWDVYVVRLGRGPAEIRVPVQPGASVEGVYEVALEPGRPDLLTSVQESVETGEGVPGTASLPFTMVTLPAERKGDGEVGREPEREVVFTGRGSAEGYVYRIRMTR